MIEKTLAAGQQLVEQKHYASDSVKSKCQELKDCWKELLDCASERKKKLELSLKSQSVRFFPFFFFNNNEIKNCLFKNNVII